MRIISSVSIILFMVKVFISEQKLEADDSLSYEAMTQILKLGQGHRTLLISVRYKIPSINWLKEIQKNASIIISRNVESSFEILKYSHPSEKIDAIIIFMNTLYDLRTTLNKFQEILFENVMLPVYIVKLTRYNSCKIIESALAEVWKYGRSTSYFLCSPPKMPVQIYTYNAFTDRAPDSWMSMYKNEHTYRNWRIYTRNYTTGQKLNDFDFDRTKYLDGHEVTIATRAAPNASFWYGRILDQKTFLENEDSFFPDALRFIQTFSLNLNITFRIYIYYERWSNQKYIESFNDFEKDIFKNSSARLLLIPRQAYTNRIFKTLYPVQSSQFGIVSRHKGYQTLIEKIYGFYGTLTLLNTIVFLFIISIFIWFNGRKNIAFVLFEILRLIIGNSLQTQMNSLSRRIFFGTVLLYFLIIQATFNGHLAKFLTKPQLRKQIENLEDLEYFGHGSLNDKVFGNLMTKMFPEERTNDKTCVNSVLNKTYEFCVGDYITLFMNAKEKSNLYISKIPFGIIYWQYSVRENWPLIDRFNKGLIQLWDFGFRKKWESLKSYWFMHNYTVAEERMRKDYQPIKLENFSLFFLLFIFGVVVSILSFGVELFLGPSPK